MAGTRSTVLGHLIASDASPTSQIGDRLGPERRGADDQRCQPRRANERDPQRVSGQLQGICGCLRWNTSLRGNIGDQGEFGPDRDVAMHRNIVGERGIDPIGRCRTESSYETAPQSDRPSRVGEDENKSFQVTMPFVRRERQRLAPTT
jgi:hypothetical protein